MTKTLPQNSTYSLIPSRLILAFPHTYTTFPASFSSPDSCFFSQQTPLHRGCARWASPVEANVR